MTALDVVHVSGMRDDERGGAAVVVLHGWGAAGTDLVPLAQALQRLACGSSCRPGRCPKWAVGARWWHLDPDTTTAARLHRSAAARLSARAGGDRRARRRAGR